MTNKPDTSPAALRAILTDNRRLIDPDNLAAIAAWRNSAFQVICALATEKEAHEKAMADLRTAVARESREIEQTLGKALGYPWYKDAPKNFPNATEANGVCVGEHVPASLAVEAARKITNLTRERESARATLEAFEEENKRNRERAERAEADAAAMLQAWLDYIEVFNVQHNPECPADDTCGCPHIARIEGAISSTAGRDLLERMERMQEALDGINTFAWSAMIADCEETRLECGRRINACRAALADKEPTP